MTPRLKVRLPIVVALAVSVAAYVFRSTVLRGGDFALDLPADVLAILVLCTGVGFVAYARHRRRSDDEGASDATRKDGA